MKIASTTAQHNVFKFTFKQQHQITLNSDFDSGNLGKMEFTNPNILTLAPANDCAGTQYEGLSKSWFYFSITGVPSQIVLKFVIRNLHMLASISKFSDHYRPVYKVKGEDYRRVASALVTTKEQQTQVQFEHRFEKLAETFFAFSFPCSYQQCQNSLHTFERQLRLNKEIYFHNQVIIQSPEKRNINLVTISSQEGKEINKQSTIKDCMFGITSRSNKFRPNKKVVLITARVHPGQTPGSHAMNGMIKFLVSKDARALMLRKFFVFMLIPMLNPDGVYHGHYRMDIFNQNLNRFYLNPDPVRQPAPFAVKYLAQYLTIQDRLFFYMDLHAHAGKKGNFFYGNALDDLNQQVETQLFAKILSLNCVNFEYDNSNFTKKQMVSKDRNQQMTKQGCGRVVIHKTSNLTYSYTLQCGYHMSSLLNDLPLPINSHRKVERMGYIYDELDNLKSPLYSQGAPYFTPLIYENVGKSILITILDIFNQNPYSRIPNSTFKDIESIRRQLNYQLAKNTDRFKKEQTKSIYKSKKQNQSISDALLLEFERQGVFQLKKPKSRLTHKLTQNISKPKEMRRNIRIRDYTMPKMIGKSVL